MTDESSNTYEKWRLTSAVWVSPHTYSVCGFVADTRVCGIPTRETKARTPDLNVLHQEGKLPAHWLQHVKCLQDYTIRKQVDDYQYDIYLAPP